MQAKSKDSSWSSKLATVQPIQTQNSEDIDDVEETLSSDEEEVHDVEGPDDDEHAIVGISIGKAQTRLKSPATPAAEKAAILNDSADHGFFSYEDVLQITHAEAGKQPVQDSQPTYGTNDQGVRNSSSPISLPTPWVAGPRDFEVVNTRANELSLFRPIKGRTRSTTSPSTSTASGAQTDRKSSSIFSFPSFPSLPKLPNFFPTAQEQAKPVSSNVESNASTARPQHRQTQSQSEGIPLYEEPEPMRTRRRSSEYGAPRPHVIRRSTSDGSLYLQRTLSKASSLGDDARWINVNQQVNSRMKAIRDSLADSNIKIPRKLPSFSVPPQWKRTSSSITGAYQGALPTVQRLVGSHNRSMGSISRSLESSEVVPPQVPAGMTNTTAATHPEFTRALRHLKGDVVILGGYRGSVLRWAEPPYRQCWVPVKVGLNIRKVNLEVGLQDEDEEKMEETIIPSGMLKNIGPVEISRRLFKRLRACENSQAGLLRVHDFGYDWRLSPHLLSRKLIDFLQSLPCNSDTANPGQRGATVIAHSLGGLITRHAVNQRPDLFSGVIYAGVPHTCVNILGPLRNGDDVLLSSKVLTAQVNFTIRTSFALLPLDGKCFFNRDTNERFDVDFFDPKTWEEYRLSPCLARPLPAPSPASPPSTVVETVMGSLASVLPNALSRRRNSSPRRSALRSSSRPGTPPKPPSPVSGSGPGGPHAVTPGMGNLGPPADDANNSPETNVSTAVTIPKADARDYLTRTLAAVKRFKQETTFKPSLAEQGAYPPAAVIYGKSIPTVYGAHVQDREAIKRADAYDSLAFASGDGVVLARAAQLPEGYSVVKGGVVSSERGHVSLLGDLEAVGKCLNAVMADQRRRGREMSKGSSRGESLQGSKSGSLKESRGSTVEAT